MSNGSNNAAGHDPLFSRPVIDRDGTIRLEPDEPVEEIGAAEAEKVLGCSRDALDRLMDSPLAQKFIRWRWKNKVGKGGYRLFEKPSLLAYKQARQELKK